MRRRVGWSVVTLGVPTAVLSCGALIGTKDIFFDADGGGSTVEGGGLPDSGGPPSDGGGGVDAPGDSPSSGDGGVCGDTTTSAANCGRCGHSCLGGACLASQCQPVQLAANISPRDIAVDALHVYWIEPAVAHAMQADLDGNNKIQLGGGTSNYLIGLGVDDASAFWGTRDELILRCKIGGCANSPAVVTSAITSIGGVAIDGVNAYWIEDPFGPSTVNKIAKTATGGTGQQLVLDSADAGAFNRVATDGQFVYWTADDGKVRRVSTNGGAVTVVAGAAGAALGLTVDDSNVYWTAGDDPGTVNMAPKAGSSGGAALAAAQHLPIGVAVDQNSIYWVNGGIGTSPTSGSVMTCKIASCTPTELATNQRTPVAIVVDATAIYWSNFDLGSSQGGIYKIAKP
jgi:hypothetical protein